MDEPHIKCEKKGFLSAYHRYAGKVVRIRRWMSRAFDLPRSQLTAGLVPVPIRYPGGNSGERNFFPGSLRMAVASLEIFK